MLARAACEASEGPFADFALDPRTNGRRCTSPRWLHDCGKVTTPEYVVDKATKLETIYDRIHEVRMRFEVLKRDAEIAYWQRSRKAATEPALRRDARCANGASSTTDSPSSRAATRAASSWRRSSVARLKRDRRAHLDAHARRPHRHRRTRSGSARQRSRRAAAAGDRAAARRQARAPASSAGPPTACRRTTAGASASTSGASLQPRRTLQSARSAAAR